MIAPPPWHLTGNGYIWLFKSPRKCVERNGFMMNWQRNSLRGTLGSVMLVDYRTTNVGPYFELLFIPGRFRLAGQITSAHATVCETASRTGAFLLKEQAEFTRTTQANGSDLITISCDSKPLRLGQELHGDLLITSLTTKGSVQLCGVDDLTVDAMLFPDIAQVKSIAVVAVKNFQMMFPVPHVVKDISHVLPPTSKG